MYVGGTTGVFPSAEARRAAESVHTAWEVATKATRHNAKAMVRFIILRSSVFFIERQGGSSVITKFQCKHMVPAVPRWTIMKNQFFKLR
jgi:hypothetical protein